MSREQAPAEKTYWPAASELPAEVFAMLHKPDRAINPIAIVATVDEDGFPHTAPFGSLRAITPRLLRLTSWRGHDTYANLCRDGRVTVAVLAPPDISVSIRGQARIAKKCLDADEHHAAVDIDIELVKNDMVRRLVIESGMTASVLEGFEGWFDSVLGEIEGMQAEPGA
jgi:hypothetical protein